MRRFVTVALVVLALVPAAAAPKASAPAPPADTPRLVMIDHNGLEDRPVDLGNVPFGQVATRVVWLRNDSHRTVTVDHITSACECTTLVQQDGKAVSEATLAPGAKVAVRLSVDTGRLRGLAGGVLPSNDGFHERVNVYVAEEKVHAACYIDLYGHVGFAALFEPASLDFGRVASAKGARREVMVSFDPAVYAQGGTHLIAGGSVPLVIEQADAPARGADGRIHVTYSVRVPPASAIGLISSYLTTGGLKPPKGAAAARSTDWLPVTGVIVGQASAEPRMIVFGPLPPKPAPGTPESVESAQRRTRWVLLLWHGQMPKSPARAARKRRPAPSPLEAARVETDSPGLETALVKPLSAKAARKARPGIDPPPLTGADLPPGTCRWLRVRADLDLPATAKRAIAVTVSLACGERLRLPVLWQPRRAVAVTRNPDLRPPTRPARH